MSAANSNQPEDFYQRINGLEELDVLLEKGNVPQEQAQRARELMKEFFERRELIRRAVEGKLSVEELADRLRQKGASEDEVNLVLQRVRERRERARLE